MRRFFERLEGRQLFCAAGEAADFVPAASGNAAAEAGTHLGPLPRLTVTGTLPDGMWSRFSDMPHNLAEVAAGALGGKIYVVGELAPETFVYDVAAGTWSTAAARPHPGNHHAAEVIHGKLYLFGGFDFGSEGQVQIYDPATDTWTKGAPMPFAAGSSSTAFIGDDVYVAGGIVGGSGAGGTTTNRTARYDPDTDTWTELAPMPAGRNHTAAGTDGQKLYVFGGRGPGNGDRNVTTNGFDTFQLYDPATNTWQSSDTPGSPLPPLPQARGGMGKAVYHGGAFYVIGGETLTGAGATDDGVYHRVDVYNPTTNAWATASDMPTARHGIFPVLSGNQIFVAGGGVHFGGSGSAVLEVFTPFQVPEPPPNPPPVPPPPPAFVVGRHVFYNNSAFDGNDPAANVLDDTAIASDKAAFPNGSNPTWFGNYTSYDKGINGIMIDLQHLPFAASPTAADFAFELGNAHPASGAWVPGPAPTSVTLRRGAGVGGSDRITLVWPDGQIQKTWLRVRVLPTANTNLAAEDAFYFGNWPGESGNKPGVVRRNGERVRVAQVNKGDVSRAAKFRTRRKNPEPVGVTSVADFNRDGVVDVLDRKIAAQNRTSRTAYLVLF